jgi:integrase
MPEEQKKKVIPSQEEMARILVASGAYRPFFLLLFACAGRLGEINNLRWEDINFEKRTVTLWTRKGTGEIRPQIKPMNQEVFDELSRLYNKRSTGWVFPNPETGQPYWNRRSQIRNACRSAGVPYYPWHSIRHHVASLLSDHFKVSLPTIQKMLGHTQVSTTSRYVQSLGQDVVEAAEMLTTGVVEQKRNLR